MEVEIQKMTALIYSSLSYICTFTFWIARCVEWLTQQEKCCVTQQVLCIKLSVNQGAAMNTEDKEYTR